MFQNNQYKLIFLVKSDQAFENVLNTCNQQLRYNNFVNDLLNQKETMRVKNTDFENIHYSQQIRYNQYIYDIVNHMENIKKAQKKEFIIISSIDYNLFINNVFSFFLSVLLDHDFKLIVKHVNAKKKYYCAIFKDVENAILINKVPFNEKIRDDFYIKPNPTHLDNIYEDNSTDYTFINNLKQFVIRTIISASNKRYNSKDDLNLVSN
jgi:hypothetical protein